MKFYMKQKVFSLKQDFDIYNDKQEPVYRVDSKLISFGRKAKILDLQSGEALCEVNQKVFSLFPTVDVTQNGKFVSRIRKKFSFFKPKYVIEGMNWVVDGSILQHDYTIFDNQGKEIASIKKKFLSWSDTFEFEIINETVDEVLILATILAIDLAMDLSES
ncbi:LURP-one-related/scramblase family protein [Facklamia sp. 7083-14-GEN3]|uniref:LURP-one-related/scramblase family protein n=1 Tax=Facklamia sp. 7083-14-GEN3 TaxID=2973478 RepID=UPI00215BBB51|nr:LURP-one-related family protein [Facklamia sp. 7083-14-GEN3]MCR8969565.1 LURP-one-related family protein [Facklamia sp. 7083-14-GEN3]